MTGFLEDLLLEMAVIGMVWLAALIFKPEFKSGTITFLAFLAATVVLFSQ